MSALDLQKLLEPVSPDAPSGPNLEYDADFAEMERAAQGKEEQQYGSTVIEAQEPEWAGVKRAAQDLLGRTHDLRIAIYLTRAVVHTEGWPALRDCLALLRGMIDKYWDSVHPQLDPEDDNDPTMRVNTVIALCDNATVLNAVRTLPVVATRQSGKFSRRDIGIATGELPPLPNVPPVKMSLVDAAFLEVDLEQLRTNAKAVGEALEELTGLEKSLTAQVGVGNARSFDPLAKELETVKKILLERLARRGASLDVDGESAAAPSGAAPAPAAAPQVSNGAALRAPVAANWDVEIGSRHDAIRAIEKVCKYFETSEPSSPLPLLLRRAMRLSTKSFLEILRDISPDGVSQAESLGGISGDQHSSESSEAAPSAPARQTTPVNNDY